MNEDKYRSLDELLAQYEADPVLREGMRKARAELEPLRLRAENARLRDALYAVMDGNNDPYLTARAALQTSVQQFEGAGTFEPVKSCTVKVEVVSGEGGGWPECTHEWIESPLHRYCPRCGETVSNAPMKGSL